MTEKLAEGFARPVDSETAERLLEEARQNRKKRDRNFWIGSLVVVIAVVALGVALLKLADRVETGASEAKATKIAVQQRVISDRRADCRSEISGEFQKQRDVLTGLEGMRADILDRALYDSAATGAKATEEDRKRFADLLDSVSAQRDFVGAFPKLGDAVAHGVDVTGPNGVRVRHAPCPTPPGG